MAEAKGKMRRGKVNREMMLLKLTMFLVFGATTSLIPYLTIHMQQIGLTVEEIATIYLTLLLTTFLAPPITGFLVDKFGKYKPVVILCLLFNLIFHHSLHLIPERDSIDVIPDTFMAHVIDRNTVQIQWPSCNNEICSSDKAIKSLIKNCAKNFEFFEAPFDNQTIYRVTSTEGIFELKIQQEQIPDFLCDVKLPLNETPISFLRDCQVEMNATSLCSSLPKTTMDATFWLYLFARLLATGMMQGSLTLIDAVAFNMIETYGGDFGKEKLFSSIGMAIFTPLTGLLIDYFTIGDGSYTNYTPAFYTYDILLLLSLISVYLMPIGGKPPAEDIGKNLLKIMKMPHVVIFLIFLFCLGNFWGFIENYLFVIMKEMGSPNYLLGLTYTIGTVVSIPLLYCTGKLTKYFGFVNLLVIAFFAHSVRIGSYSFISNPFWCFPIECMEAISCYFMWVIATTYCAILAPNDLIATLIGVGCMVHFCFGKSSGSFLGGFLIGQVGTKLAFRYVGYLAIGLGIIYKIVHVLYLKKFDHIEDDSEKEEEKEEAVNLQEHLHKHNRRESYIIELNKRLSLGTKYEGFGSMASLSKITKHNCHCLEPCIEEECKTKEIELVQRKNNEV